MRMYPVFSWQNFWMGLRWDSFRQRLQVNPVPMLGLVLEFGEFREGVLKAAWWCEEHDFYDCK